MWKIATLGLIGVLAVPALAGAQGRILESAERLVAETALQEVGGTRRSMARMWLGVGLASGGAVVAFMRQSCRVAGALLDDSALHVSLVNIAGSASCRAFRRPASRLLPPRPTASRRCQSAWPAGSGAA